MMAATYRMIADASLRYLTDKGRISEESYKTIKERNQQYAAMQRFLGLDSEAPIEGFGFVGGKNLTSGRETINKFTGSMKAIEDPVANLLRNSYGMYREADRNEIMQAFHRLVVTNRGMYDGKPVDLAGIAQVASGPENGAVPVWIDGKKSYLLLEEGILQALQRNNEVFVPQWWHNILRAPNQLLRSGIVNMPPFVVRNRIRDTMDTVIKSRHGVGVLETFKRPSADEKRLYDFFGGGIGRAEILGESENFYKARDVLLERMRSEARGRSAIVWIKDQGRGYVEIREAGERGPRLAEMRKAFETASKMPDWDQYDRMLFSASAARDLIDFAQGGQFSKVVSRYFSPFFNAQIQGQRANASAFMKDKAGFGRRWAMRLLSLSIIAYLWNKMNNAEEEYRALPAHQRDFFWNFKVKGFGWVRIPKPFEAGFASSTVERVVDGIMGNPHAFEGWTESAKQALVPIDESAVAGGPASPAIEAMSNYDFFRERPIVPPYEENLYLTDREGTKNASRFGKFMQEVTGIDARKADHVFEGFLGIRGSIITTLSDIGREDRPMMPARAVDKAVGITAEAPGYNSPDVQWVLQEARGAGMRTNPLKAFTERFFNAKTVVEKESAAKDLRIAAAQLRTSIEFALSRNPDPKLRKVVVESVLSGGPKERKKANPLNANF
jgi:hypothetical protein